jgi:hypothetical protein
MQMGFMQILSAGPVPNPTYLGGSIGTSFMTPEQAAWKTTRRKYGTLDDPDAGGYSLSQIDWSKDDGTVLYSQCDPTKTGWYA